MATAAPSETGPRTWVDDIPLGRDFVRPPLPSRRLTPEQFAALSQIVVPPPPEPVALDSVRASLLKRITELKTETSDPQRLQTIDALGTLYGSDLAGPFWTTPSGFLEVASSVATEIRNADDYAIDPSQFDLPSFNGNSPVELADGELRMTLAVLQYASEAYGGRFQPNDISLWLDNKLEIPEPASLLPRIASARDAAAELRSLHPSHPDFEKLRIAYLVAKGKRQPPPLPVLVKVPDGPRIKLGESHPHVAVVRERLGITTDGDDPTYLDRELAKEIYAYFRSNGRRGRYEVNDDLRALLNAAPRPPRMPDLRKIEANMLRWRWLPRNLGQIYVWNNLPEYETRLIRDGHVMHKERIIIGQPSQQTPIFSDTMEHIVFKPQWGVPNSIKISDLLPRLRGGDYGVLARRGMRIVKDGRTVDPSLIRWSSTDIRYLSIVTGPGPGNPLGELKFMFPNKHSVYMHDTTSKGLFDSRERAFSHGCIRVRNPRKLAQTIFAEVERWQPDLVGQLLQRNAEDNNKVDLPVRIPVHNVYFTLVPNENGGFTELRDVYGHDKRIAEALAGRPLSVIAASDPARLHNERIEEIERSSRWSSDDDYGSGRRRYSYDEDGDYNRSYLGRSSRQRPQRNNVKPAWPPFFGFFQ